MPDEWLTLTEAADRLSISTWTARRWVREGRLYAEVRSGPYGPQYYVPAAQVLAARRSRTAAAAGQAAKATPPPEPDANGSAPDAAPATLEAVWEQVQQLRQQDEARWAAVREEVAALRRELAELRDGGSGREPERRRRWWHLW